MTHQQHAQFVDAHTNTAVEYARHFKSLICAPAFDPGDLEGQRLQTTTEEIERDGYGVMKSTQN